MNKYINNWIYDKFCEYYVGYKVYGKRVEILFNEGKGRFFWESDIKIEFYIWEEINFLRVEGRLFCLEEFVKFWGEENI